MGNHEHQPHDEQAYLHAPVSSGDMSSVWDRQSVLEARQTDPLTPLAFWSEPWPPTELEVYPPAASEAGQPDTPITVFDVAMHTNQQRNPDAPLFPDGQQYPYTPRETPAPAV